MDPSELIVEIDRAAENLAQAPVVDQKREFVSNVYPLLRLMAETMGLRQHVLLERVDGIELAVAEYLTGQESMILPELATRIHVAIGLGMHLADAVENMFAATHEQLRAQSKETGVELPDEAYEIPQDIATYIVAFRTSAAEVTQLVEDVTAETVEDEDEDEPAPAPEAPTDSEEPTDA
jgi:hypothetical protein